jgi:protoporphyrinogen/coproporphyrinogen III oxidase
MNTQVAVIGGGISGLACAYRLFTLGISVTLLEAEERVGGLIGTVEQDGFLFETGPQSFQGIDTVLDLVRDVGLENHLEQADPRAPRYVLRHGKLEKIPMSPQAILGSSLLGLGSRWRVATEALKRTKPPSQEESVAQFVRRKFGHEILEYLVVPFVSGVYAGDPEKLSLRAAFPSLDEWERQYGSVLRGASKSRPAKGAGNGPPPLCSFDRGMAMLTGQLATKLGERVQTGARVNAIAKGGENGSQYRIQFTQSGRAEVLDATAVILAAPAYTAGKLLSSISEPLARTLSGIEYTGVAVIGAAYHAYQVGTVLDGFGLLIPRTERIRTLGIVWNSALFGGRGGQGRVSITSFVGGATDAAMLEMTDTEILATVENESAKLLQITGRPILSRLWRHPKALPQYNLGHGHIVEAIRSAERAIPGLYFAGNYLEGPSIGKCIARGTQTAEAAREFLRATAAKSA